MIAPIKSSSSNKSGNLWTELAQFAVLFLETHLCIVVSGNTGKLKGTATQTGTCTDGGDQCGVRSHAARGPRQVLSLRLEDAPVPLF